MIPATKWQEKLLMVESMKENEHWLIERIQQDARTCTIEEAAKEVAHYMGVPLADCHCAQAILSLLKKEKKNDNTVQQCIAKCQSK